MTSGPGHVIGDQYPRPGLTPIGVTSEPRATEAGRSLVQQFGVPRPVGRLVVARPRLSVARVPKEVARVAGAETAVYREGALCTLAPSCRRWARHRCSRAFHSRVGRTRGTGG